MKVLQISTTNPSFSLSFYSQQVECRESKHEHLQAFVNESIARIRSDCMGRLFLGLCGKCEYKVIEFIIKLFTLLLVDANASEINQLMVASLQHEHFLLGDLAKSACLSTIIRYVEYSNDVHQRNNMLDPFMTTFFESIWKLHQVEDTDSLPASDEVLRFVQLYS